VLWLLLPNLASALFLAGFLATGYLVDANEGQIPRTTAAAYLNYQLNRFAILAGPIQRFQDFQPGWRDPKPLLADRPVAPEDHRRRCPVKPARGLLFQHRMTPRPFAGRCVS